MLFFLLFNTHPLIFCAHGEHDQFFVFSFLSFLKLRSHAFCPFFPFSLLTLEHKMESYGPFIRIYMVIRRGFLFCNWLIKAIKYDRNVEICKKEREKKKRTSSGVFSVASFIFFQRIHHFYSPQSQSTVQSPHSTFTRSQK